MSELREDLERTALAWLVRVNDPAFGAWDDWEAWLARDPRHAEVYWRLAAAEADIVDALAAEVAAGRSPAPAVRRPAVVIRRSWFAVAAAAAAVLLGVTLWLDRPQTWSVETQAGEQRSLMLADGSQVHLDGATRVTLDRSRPRYAELDRGRILVEVIHDERRPFSVLAGDAVLTDLGTAFDVTRLTDGVRVAVSEGVVRVDVDEQAVTLRAGDALLAVDGALSRRTVAPEDVGAWRGGRLSYRDERLAVVAEDLARALGRPVTVAPAIADRRFTGSLAADGPPEALRARLELVLGVTIVDDGGAWRLEPRTRP